MFLVTWTAWSPDGTTDVYGARVDTSGVVLDPGGFPIAAAAGSQREASVGFGGGIFLVAWTDFQDVGTWSVHGVRVDPVAGVGGRIAIATGPGGHEEPAVSYGAGTFLVVWKDSRLGAGSEVFGARVSPAGSVLDPSGIAISVAAGEQQAPAVAFGGTAFLVVWEDSQFAGSQIRGARVDPAGAVLDPTAIQISTTVTDNDDAPAVTALGERFLVGWYGSSSPGMPEGVDALGARIDADGTGRSEFVISATIGRSYQPGSGMALSTGGSGFFAAWEDIRSGPTALYGAEVTVEAVVRGPGTALAWSADGQGQSAVAFDGTNHLVAFSDRRGAVAARIDPAGRMLDPSPIVLDASGGGQPSVAFDGTNYLVAWSGPGFRVAAVRVSPDGYRIGDPVEMPLPPPYDREQLHGPSVASNGSGFLVTWVETPHSGGAVLRAARVTPDGGAAEPVDVARAYYLGEPAVASDGSGYLVTWYDGSVVRGGRVGADGSPLDPEGITISALPGYGGAVAWNGQRYLVAWATLNESGETVMAARVTSDGTVQDPDGILVAGGPGGRGGPVVAANGPFLVAWRERDGDPDRRTGVLAARVGDDGVVRDVPGLRIAARDQEWQALRLSPGAGRTWAMTYTRYVPEAPYAVNRVFFRTIAPK
jgi:hypothetical protein